MYVIKNQGTQSVAWSLMNAGFKTEAYNAGLNKTERNRIHDAFMRDEITIIVATIAFGMGVHKSNIRHIIHYNMPASLESYVQEIGRAGRDGETAWCNILLSDTDRPLVRWWAKRDTERNCSASTVHSILKDIFQADVYYRSEDKEALVREVPIGELSSAHNAPKEAVKLLLAFIEIYRNLIETFQPIYMMADDIIFRYKIVSQPSCMWEMVQAGSEWLNNLRQKEFSVFTLKRNGRILNSWFLSAASSM